MRGASKTRSSRVDPGCPDQAAWPGYPDHASKYSVMSCPITHAIANYYNIISCCVMACLDQVDLTRLPNQDILTRLPDQDVLTRHRYSTQQTYGIPTTSQALPGSFTQAILVLMAIICLRLFGTWFTCHNPYQIYSRYLILMTRFLGSQKRVYFSKPGAFEIVKYILTMLLSRRLILICITYPSCPYLLWCVM